MGVLTPYAAGTYADRNTGAACWSCAGLTTGAPGPTCTYPDSHRGDNTMTTDTKLTTTQYSALAELRHRGALVASRHAFADDNTRTFSQRTLDALVDAGHA